MFRQLGLWDLLMCVIDALWYEENRGTQSGCQDAGLKDRRNEGPKFKGEKTWTEAGLR